MRLPRRLDYVRGPLELTALVDVVFLLLIFFMLSSTLIVQPGFRIDLPRTSLGQSTQMNQLVISLVLGPERREASSGKAAQREVLVFLNDQVLPLAQLATRLQEVGRERGGQTLVIRADQAVPHGQVVAVMEMALQRNWSVVLATQRD